MSITEALAEIPLIEKRIAKAGQRIVDNVARYEYEDDPYAKDGGSDIVVDQARQSVNDLGERLSSIRVAIAIANQNTPLNIVPEGEKTGVTMTIAEWLVWRREVAPKSQSVLTNAIHELRGMMSQAREKPKLMPQTDEERQAGATQQIAKLIPNINLGDLEKAAANVESVLAQLDGKLALFIATTKIQLP